jgi:hypothetical protein
VREKQKPREDAMTKHSTSLRIFDPTIPFPKTAGGLAPRGPIRGKRVGLLENSKRNSDVILQTIGSLLAEQARVAVAGLWRKPDTLPGSQEIVEEMLAKCDLVITGVGD